MRVRIKSMDELLASGWRDEGSLLRFGGQSERYQEIIVREMYGTLGGVLDASIRENGRFVYDSWTFSDEMYVVVADDAPLTAPAVRPHYSARRFRIRTREELLALGFTVDPTNGHRLNYPAGSVGARSGIAIAGGRVDLGTSLMTPSGDEAIGIVHYNGWRWGPEALEELNPTTNEPLNPSTPEAQMAAKKAKSSKPVRNPAVKKFRDAPRMVARGMITCGFELETQSTEGQQWNNIEAEDSYDEEAMMNDIDAEVESSVDGLAGRLLSRLPESIWPKTSETVQKYYAEKDFWMIGKQLREEGFDGAGSLVDAKLLTQTQLDRAVQKLREYFMDTWDRSDYSQASEDDPREYMEANYSIPEDIQVGSDGSVDGFEFRTRGALTYPRFKRAADGLFKLKHEIDTGCSFHIHLAVRGVKPVYSTRLQKAMVEYLIENIARVPESVRKRWVDTKDNQYISRLVSRAHDKYSFIHFHAQGTWEFRCFGNVLNARDGMKCLDLAIEAYQYGYAVVAGREQLIGDEYFADDATWTDAAYEALRRSESLTRVIARRRLPQVA